MSPYSGDPLPAANLAGKVLTLLLQALVVAGSLLISTLVAVVTVAGSLLIALEVLVVFLLCSPWLLPQVVTGTRRSTLGSWIIAGALSLFIGGGIAIDFWRFMVTPIKPEATERELASLEGYEVRQGMHLGDILADLHRRGLELQHPLFVPFADLLGYDGRIRIGEYAINPQIWSPYRLLRDLTSSGGKQYAVALIEGKTFKQALNAIWGQRSFVRTLGLIDYAELARQLDLPAGVESPEGWLLPETYHFPRGTSDMQVLRRAVAEMKRFLDREWQRRVPHPEVKSKYQALILASMVEREAGLASERGQIAAVLLRRLEKRIKLQIDSTLIYGLGDEFDGDLRRVHLRRDGPYNTYTRYGPPPTPIALPSREAIRALFHPADSEALYFVARGDGSHHFSKTLAEHNRAVDRYQRRRRKSNKN